MKFIRQATISDRFRLAEIEVFNYRLYFYPIFQDDHFYFEELSVASKAKAYQDDKQLLFQTYVYDDGVVKGFIRIDGREVKKLFVEPVLQGNSIGAKLLRYAIEQFHVTFLWALEKNTRAVSFYKTYGFHPTNIRTLEEGTTEYLIRLERNENS